ncbi:hypothetical protein RKD23_004075 [Streptomyces sp. SAI-170]|uniref:hypothetical protein n=1 Tax=Streptomyces sp. SAI-170 TaxID=3377729 RepID=UPI003C79B52E
MSRRRYIQEATPRYAVPPPLLPPPVEPSPAPRRNKDVFWSVLLTAVSVGSMLVAAGLHLLL